MIIRAVRAENFMRFSRLSVADLPRQGLIGLEGPNESGKSTIGEAILFAFFGRTRSSKTCPIENLIQWGKEFLRVEVEFTVLVEGEERGFQVFREIDRFGTNYVKLVALPERSDVAVGNIQVGRFLERQIGLTYQEFEQAFYHDQYGSRVVDPSLRQFVEGMTGIAQMDQAVDGLRAEIERRQREFGHYQKDLARNQKQIDRHAQAADRMPELEENVGRLADSLDGLQQEIAGSRSAVEVQRRAATERQDTEKRLREVAGLPSDEVGSHVVDLLAGYERLELEQDDEASPLRELRSEIRTSRDGLRRVDRFLRDYNELSRAYEDAGEVVRNELDAENLDGVLARSIRGEEERKLHIARRRKALRRLPFLALAALFFGGLAIAVALRPALLESVGLKPEMVQPVPVAIGLACLAGVFLVWDLVLWMQYLGSSAVLRSNEQHVVDLQRQVELARKQEEQFEALRAVRHRGEVAEFVERARAIEMASMRRRIDEFERTHRRLIGERPRDAGDGAPASDGQRVDDGRDKNAAATGTPAVERKGGSEAKGGRGKRRGGKRGSSRASRNAEGDDFRALLRSLADREAHCQKRLQSVSSEAEKRSKELDRESKTLRAERERLEGELRDCEAQRVKREALEVKNAELEQAAAEVRSGIDDHLAAIELLEICVRTIRAKLGPKLGQFVRAVLPHLTAGRYRDVRLSDDLDFQVYTDEPGDFVDAVELSGGTNEALLLGLRLALSQAYVSSRSGQPQFIFLDEPFKMMDYDRVVATLEALPSLSSDLCQFFLVKPEYSEAQRAKLDALIRTQFDSKVLDVKLGASSEPAEPV